MPEADGGAGAAAVEVATGVGGGIGPPPPPPPPPPADTPTVAPEPVVAAAVAVEQAEPVGVRVVNAPVKPVAPFIETVAELELHVFVINAPSLLVATVKSLEEAVIINDAPVVPDIVTITLVELMISWSALDPAATVRIVSGEAIPIVDVAGLK